MKKTRMVRKSPLKSKAPFVSASRLQRTSSLVAKKVAIHKGPPEVKLRAKNVRLRMDPDLRAAVLERAGHCCDLCGRALSTNRWECHHRRLKSQGGLDDPVNLLALHHACHDAAHLDRPWSKTHGFIVHKGHEPASRPVWRHGKSWQLPTPTAWVQSDPPEDFTERSAA